MTELTTANRTTVDDAPTEPAATVRTVDDVVAEIDLPYTGKLPEAALREIQRRPAEFVPRLIELLRRAMNAVRAGEDYDNNGHFFALHLLTEFKAREAWPTILETLSLPKDGPYVLYNDVLYHTLPQILAEFLADDQAALDRLIDDDALDEGVRWAATVALLSLVRDGRLSRDEAVRRLRARLAVETASEDADWKVATGLVLELAKYAPREALAEIRQAFERNLVDVSCIRLEDVERNVADGNACLRKALEKCPPTGIADTVEELCQWGWFDDDESPPRTALPSTLDDDMPFDLPLDHRFESSTTIVNDGPRIGRNDPCPCGSGKKYKKCCGAG